MAATEQVVDVARISNIMAYECASTGGRPFNGRGMVELSSEGAPWGDLRFELVRVPPIEVFKLSSRQHAVVIHLDQPTIDFYTGTHVTTAALRPGDVGARPAGVITHEHVHHEHRKMYLALSDSTLKDTAAQYGLQYVEPMFHWGDRDPQFIHLAFALKGEVEQGYPSGRIFGEAIRTALAVHILQKYTVFPLKIGEFKGGLSRWQLQRTLKNIRESLSEDLSLDALAASVNLSPFHFSRMFKESTGMPPHRYVLKQRIEHACQMLASGRLSLAEIAARLGFADQSHFGSAFKRFVGVTPTTFRRQS